MKPLHLLFISIPLILGMTLSACTANNAIPANANPSNTTEVSPKPSSDTKVSITSTGFSPQSVSIKIGETITWTNNDTANHTVNSDPHPTHTNYPPLNIGTFQPGETKSLAFPTAGTYGYHDHLHPQNKGTVIVK